jgi:hypothetical protein
MPFVAGLNNPPALTYLTVGRGHGLRIPITEFYAAMGKQNLPSSSNVGFP